MTRVVVTGVGLVSPLGPDAPGSWASLCEGERAFAPVTLFDVRDQRTQVAAEVRGLRVGDVAPAAEVEQWSRTDAMALVAAREALAASGGRRPDLPLDLVFGGTTGGLFETEGLLAAMHREPARFEPMRQMLSHPLSATADRLHSVIGPLRRTCTLSSACSSGANAILVAAGWIASGKSARVLAGGADGLSLLTFTGFNVLAATDPSGARPFDEDRAGMTLGEGAGFLVLEEYEAALLRGVEPVAELVGWASGSEAHHITHPEQDGATAARVFARALSRAGLATADVDYINAHGTGTRQNDRMEARAYATALGSHAARVPVSSVKGQIGHALGGAGALEAAFTVLALRDGRIPPTGGLERPDPLCPLLHVTGRSWQRDTRVAASSSFGFGGADTVLVFAKPGSPSTTAEDRRRSGRSRVVVSAAAAIGPHGSSRSAGLCSYLEAGTQLVSPGVRFDAREHLDLAKARRLDRRSRMLTAALQNTMAEAAAGGYWDPEVGVVAGIAYGDVDGCAQFVRSIFDRGPRLASPLSFPNLVPSSSAAQAAIYLGARGLVLTVSDLGMSGEAAIGLAYELVASGEVGSLLAGAVEEESEIVDRVLGPLCSGGGEVGVRGEGAAAVLLETAGQVAHRRARPLASVLGFWSGRGESEDAGLPVPTGTRPLVIVARGPARVEGLGPWRDAPRAEIAPRAGRHEALGAFAVAAGAQVVAEGQSDDVLVFGVAHDRWAALRLGPA